MILEKPSLRDEYVILVPKDYKIENATKDTWHYTDVNLFYSCLPVPYHGMLEYKDDECEFNIRTSDETHPEISHDKSLMKFRGFIVRYVSWDELTARHELSDMMFSKNITGRLAAAILRKINLENEKDNYYDNDDGIGISSDDVKEAYIEE